MKMRLMGSSISNRHYEALLKVDKEKFDGRKMLQAIKKVAEEMDYYVKYFSRKPEPYVYVKYASESRNGTDYAYVFVRSTSIDDLKKIVVRNHGFGRKCLENFTDLILINLNIENLDLQFNRVQQESQLCLHEQLSLFQSG